MKPTKFGTLFLIVLTLTVYLGGGYALEHDWHASIWHGLSAAGDWYLSHDWFEKIAKLPVEFSQPSTL